MTSDPVALTEAQVWRNTYSDYYSGAGPQIDKLIVALLASEAARKVAEDEAVRLYQGLDAALKAAGQPYSLNEPPWHAWNALINVRDNASIAPSITRRLEAAENAARADGRKWQPIETAPKDGTMLILAHFKDNRLVSAASDRWSEDFDNWVDWPPESQLPNYRPTHWMLPPEPPRARGAK